MTAPPEWRLYLGTKSTGITVRQDEKYPNMFRIHAPDRPPSDMVNLARAKDAALAWGCKATGRPSEELQWKIGLAARERPGTP